MKIFDAPATIRLLVYVALLGLAMWAGKCYIDARIQQLYNDAI